MKALYEDIRKRIKEEPKWFDCNGVPRYDKFHPRLSPNIYADQVALVEIECQQCGKRFLVEVNWDDWDEEPDLKTRIKEGWIGYGDPPQHPETFCFAGCTMTAKTIRVVEFWEKKKSEWRRNKRFEIEINKVV